MLSVSGTPSNGLVSNPYGLQLSATGGTAPYTFALASGSTLPSTLTLSSSGLISGTLPATAGNVNFTVQATDNSASHVSGTGQFTIPVSAGPDGSQTSLLSGSYTWYFGGLKDADGSKVAMVGTVTVDGSGNVTSGALDINTSAGSFMTTGPVTGTYKVGSDWRGIMKVNWGSAVWQATPNSGTPSNATVPTLPSIFAIALGRTTGGTPNIATRARLIGFDDPLTGVHGQGYLETQSIAGATLAGLAGGYAFIAGGTDLSQNNLFVGGVIGLDANGNITSINSTPSSVDMFTGSGGQVSGPVSGTLSGSATFNATTGRISWTMTPNQSPSGVKFPTHYVAYLQQTGGGTYLLPMSVDSQAAPASFPAIFGDMNAQMFNYVPSVTNAYLTGNFSWFESGKILSGSSTSYFSEIGQASCNAASCALNQGFVNQGSGWQTISAGMGGVSMSPNGRVVLSGVNGAPTFFYMYYLDGAYMDGWVMEGSSQTGKVGIGELDDQGLPLTSLSLPASLLLNTSTPRQTTQFDASGTLTLSAASGAFASVTGTVDHASAGFVSYGDTFGPWTLQIPNGYGISQAVDGSGNTLGACVTDWISPQGSPLEMVCLPNGLEPNGDVPTPFWVIRQ